ncbi:MAG TPA: hypothetical protein VK477_02065, partial [Acidobacteriota bacterium]|nr:hypothetical protein [Acidobacteriota bacterium]
AFPARWYLPAELVAQPADLLRAHGFANELADELVRRFRASPFGTYVVPDAPLLARFTPANLDTWREWLVRHPGNITYRWPLSLDDAQVARLDAEPRWQETMRRLRLTARPISHRLIFTELYALEDTFASAADRRAFYQIALGADALLVKLRRAPGRTLDAATQAAYWQLHGRYRAVEPMLNAIASLPNGPRLDLVHILPTLPRSLLNTFSPNFAEADDAGIESSVAASDFFALAPGADPRTEGTFQQWLDREAEAVAGPPRYGDLLVYGDLAATPWPYTVVYIADGIGFARRPVAFGPWQLLPLEEVPVINPRFAGRAPQIFRPRSARAEPAATPFLPSRMPGAWRQRLELKTAPAGPWGKLRFYDVLLAPAGDTLEQIPAPESKPRWVFAGVSREQLLESCRVIAMPESVRASLVELFRNAATDAEGRVTVEPPLDLVLAVPREFRTATFDHLVGGLSVTDYVQHIPFPKGFTIDEWFDAESLPASVREAIMRLVYQRGDHVMLSDFGALFQLLPTRREQLSAHRAALRVHGLVVLLEKPARDQVRAIADYWNLTGDKSIARLLESFAAAPNERFLDVIHLLPPIERELLNTYFRPSAPMPTPSCFWTAFNFGADQPDPRYLVIPGSWTEHREMAWQDLVSNFDALSEPSRLGDLIGYRRKGAAALDHLCVYLAADLVFTKNGFTFSSPWCIQRLENIDELYLTSPDVERVYFRRRSAPATAPLP